jgi:DNA repair protein RecN (Recombination protein N)
MAARIKRLQIENFALVDKLIIEFGDGMNVLTGETGAGKSVIVGAIAQLMGERADKNSVRSGKSTAVVEGEFDIAGELKIIALLDQFRFDNDGRTLTIRREIPLNSAGRIFINGRLASLARLKEIAKYLADLIGQSSHQRLLDESAHQSFLDDFAGHCDEVDQMKECFLLHDKTRKELADLETRRTREKNERELALFQKEEIEKAHIRVGEESELLAEKKILDSSRLLGDKSTLILNLLEQDGAALPTLNICRKELSQMAAHDGRLEKNIEILEEAIINLEELRAEMESYRASIPDDPERQEAINLRLDELFRLKKKYGGSEESIVENLAQIKAQLDASIDIDDQIKFLEKRAEETFEKYLSLAYKISESRRKAAKELAEKVERELKNLGIDSAKFEYKFVHVSDPSGVPFNDSRVRPTVDGLESGQFFISTNPGEPLKPLSKIASGGEISRVMLALKAVSLTADARERPFLVFDEIDAGVGGEIAHAVAKKLSDLSRRFQLLVVSHLHQIASVGDVHFAVEKVDAPDSKRRKIITARKLAEPERAKEIQRMLAMKKTESRK